MRSRHRTIGAPALILSVLSLTLAGCSSGGSQDSFATSSLRPREGMHTGAPRRYPDGSTAGGYYGRPYAQTPRRYVDPGEPTPREMAAYDSGHDRYGPPRNIQTASIGSERGYDTDARWRQPASSITTGSTGPGAAGYGRASSYVVEVQEGDTLYTLSRRHRVPLNDIVTANRLTSERIAIGQRLVIPARYR